MEKPLAPRPAWSDDRRIDYETIHCTGLCIDSIEHGRARKWTNTPPLAPFPPCSFVLQYERDRRWSDDLERHRAINLWGEQSRTQELHGPMSERPRLACFARYGI
jgi:hypothetical protein